jgi:serpin B
MVLANAVYFKGRWHDPFKKELTRDEPFTRPDGSKVQVPLMHRMGGTYRWLNEETFQALELPYAQRGAAMVVFLPRTHDGLPAFEKELTAEKLTGWLGKLEQKPGIDVFLPRFRFENGLDLNKPLMALGMKDAFVQGTADLGGMTDYPGLFIEQVIQKAFVEVNEEGTEAAAVTGVKATKAAIEENPPVFRADRPFLFFIRESQSGSVLFVGRVTNPQE